MKKSDFQRLKTKFFMVVDVAKVTRSRSKGQGQKVKVTINVKEKAGGLTPTSSCFICILYLDLEKDSMITS